MDNISFFSRTIYVLKKHIQLLKSIMLAGGICMCSLLGYSQSVSYSFDEKVIVADSLNMPQSTIAKTIISVLPELLERPSEYTINDFQIKVNDMAVDYAVDAVLTQIRLCDIEKITVVESPIASYQNNSKSGAINIKLRKHSTKDKHFWGSVSTDASLPTEVSPKVSFGYDDDKFSVNSFLIGNYYDATYDEEGHTYNANGVETSNSLISEANTFRGNMTALFMNYKPSTKDELLMNVAYVYTDDKSDYSHRIQNVHTKYSKESNRKNFNALFKYTHNFTSSSLLEFSVQNMYQPVSEDDRYEEETAMDKSNNDNLYGHLMVKFSLLPSASKYKSTLAIGTNGNIVFGKKDTNHDFLQDPDKGHFFSDKSHSRGLTPFVESENFLGQLRVKLMANLPYYCYDYHREGFGHMNKDNVDFGAKLMTEWHFKKNHILRFIADRQSNRPSETMVYPYLVFASSNIHNLGNKDLKNEHSVECTAEYVFKHKWDDHSLFMTIGTSYNHVNNVIHSELNLSGDDNYITYKNAGCSNIFTGEFMAMYSYKCMSLTLTSDYYNNSLKSEGGDDYYRYFNIVLMPTFKTQDNWMGSLRLKYFSPVSTKGYRKGGCSAVSFQLGKSWGGFNVHAYGNLSLSGRTTDIVYNWDLGHSETISSVQKNSIGFGVRYDF